MTESASLTSFEEHFRIALLLHQCWGKWSDCLKLEFAEEHAESFEEMESLIYGTLCQD